ncbi:MAG: hypothetical protein JXR46_13560 [Calditrichaceae bacterium]|nr:hypothetical protein [Calditrichaceae bacterium]MBN2710062.1 hypothetical protein [Calditrichaceae bacterium]RQV94522.1 MAG: hypothetical protein EH224_10280 [Calditrichota bacterium]
MQNKNNQNKKKTPNSLEDPYSEKSNLSGLKGFLETLLKKFRTGAFISALLPVYFLAIIAMGLAAAPGIYVFSYIFHLTPALADVVRYPILGIAAVCAYFLYGFSIIFIIPLLNWLNPFKLKPFRGSYFSLQSIPWYVHNALLYIVRYTFLEFITPTPLNILFYRMMGMKIGKGVQINTTNISDACMIELEDRVTIGGSAHLLAHYGQHGYLVVSSLKIRKNATIGLKATIMGDTDIGEGALISPHEVVLPKSIVPAGRKPEKLIYSVENNKK